MRGVPPLVLAGVLWALGGPGVLGVDWGEGPSEARSPDGLEQRVTAQLRARGYTVRNDPWEWATVEAPERIPAQLRAVARVLDERAAEAIAAFRGGDFARAESLAADLEAIVTATPLLPGAASRLRGSHLLRADLERARGDLDAAAVAVRRALALDPEARLSLRRHGPELLQIYEAEQRALLARRAAWHVVALPAEGVVEVDERVVREVPPGAHFSVWRVPGRPPLARYGDPRDPWLVAAPDRSPSVADLCRDAELDGVLRIRRVSGGLAMQRFDCGARTEESAWTKPWSGPADRFDIGLTSVLSATGGEGHEVALGELRVVPDAAPFAGRATDRAQKPGAGRRNGARPVWKRPALWIPIALVIAGAIAGAVAGTRASSAAPTRVDVGSFTDPAMP
jgi:hypothetical protein